MWLDIEQTSKSSGGGKVWEIAAESAITYEVRIAVYGARNVPAMDIEGTSDAYIRAFFNESSV